MNAILFANIALRALLLSAIGWALVRWCIPDARHRAWASLIALHHCLMSLWAWRFRRGLRPLTDTEAQLVPSTSWRAALRVFDKTGNPCVVGLRRPVIAVPRGIIGAWNSRQWMWLFRHEGEH